jgi:GT2 family glycosyltransferase
VTTNAATISKPVEVTALNGTHSAEHAVSTMRVCAILVTWNRKDYVTNVLRCLGKQTYPVQMIDVVVVDNAGTDGTLDHLIRTFNPERVVDNPTDAADVPKFQAPKPRSWSASAEAPNTIGVRSLTIVRNTSNMGGCGGFNTGFAYVEHAFGKPGAGGPDCVWLVDDDIDLPTTTLEHLQKVMASDPGIGLVGSRTCDINNRTKTIETTIYFNDQTGGMQDEAPAHSKHRAAHEKMIATFGATKGEASYTGSTDVDVVSACSMLARWSAVLGGAKDDRGNSRSGVGFWDARYFIYCDDADWCLRFGKAGWRVSLCLDAVVYHTPWNLKLTPARIYYANRNRVWMAQKVLSGDALRRVTKAAMDQYLGDSLYASLHRRVFHSRIILQTATDIADNVGGKTGSDGPPAKPIVEALREAGALHKDAVVAGLCLTGHAPKWTDDLRAIVEAEAPGECPTFITIVRNDIAAPPGSIVYGRQLMSRLKKQLWVLKRRPRACIVFDQINDFPILFGTPYTLHVDTKKPTVAQVERDGWLVRLKFFLTWLKARSKVLKYARDVQPHVSTGRYG